MAEETLVTNNINTIKAAFTPKIEIERRTRQIFNIHRERK